MNTLPPPTPEEVEEAVADTATLAAWMCGRISRPKNDPPFPVHARNLDRLLTTIQTQASEIEGLKEERRKVIERIPIDYLKRHDAPGATAPTAALDLPGAMKSYADDRWTLIERFSEAKSQVQALQSALDEALEVLKVFRTVARFIDSNWYNGPKDDRSTFRSGLAWVENGIKKTLTIGDFRRASALYDRLKGRTGA